MSDRHRSSYNRLMNDLEETSSELLSLENAKDGATRNALALRLAEAKRDGVDEVLVRLIQRPELANNRGTLVHALRHYDCAPHVALLADLVITGGFEVAHEALETIETIEHLESGDVRAAFEKVERALANDGLEDWRRPLLDDLWDKFD
jgi:hypothetical protein